MAPQRCCCIKTIRKSTEEKTAIRCTAMPAAAPNSPPLGRGQEEPASAGLRGALSNTQGREMKHFQLAARLTNTSLTLRLALLRHSMQSVLIAYFLQPWLSRVRLLLAPAQSGSCRNLGARRGKPCLGFQCCIQCRHTLEPEGLPCAAVQDPEVTYRFPTSFPCRPINIRTATPDDGASRPAGC